MAKRKADIKHWPLGSWVQLTVFCMDKEHVSLVLDLTFLN